MKKEILHININFLFYTFLDFTFLFSVFYLFMYMSYLLHNINLRDFRYIFMRQKFRVIRYFSS